MFIVCVRIIYHVRSTHARHLGLNVKVFITARNNRERKASKYFKYTIIFYFLFNSFVPRIIIIMILCAYYTRALLRQCRRAYSPRARAAHKIRLCFKNVKNGFRQGLNPAASRIKRPVPLLYPAVRAH